VADLTHTDDIGPTALALPSALVSDPVAFIEQLDEDDRRALTRLGMTRHYRKGSALLREGERSDHVVLVVRGHVKVVRAASDGREIVLGRRGPGDLVGELAAIDERPERRSASIVAVEDAVVVLIPADRFLEFLSTHARAAAALLKAVVGRLRDSSDRQVELGAYDVRRRVVHLLLATAEAGGRPSPDGIVIDLGLTQQELASTLGCSRESIARALNHFRNAGLLTTSRRRITLVDLEGLRTLAD
jgi:CRP/FNR family cyclic AMP-dependent transcriptional regulator